MRYDEHTDFCATCHRAVFPTGKKGCLKRYNNVWTPEEGPWLCRAHVNHSKKQYPEIKTSGKKATGKNPRKKTPKSPRVQTARRFSTKSCQTSRFEVKAKSKFVFKPQLCSTQTSVQTEDAPDKVEVEVLQISESEESTVIIESTEENIERRHQALLRRK